MIIYLIKLILILVFNICVNICYINSECKCCCGNSKSGGIGSGSKGNLSTNPPKGPKTPVKTHTPVKQPEEFKPTSGLNQPKCNKPIVGCEGSKTNLDTNPLKGPKLPKVTNSIVGVGESKEGDGLKEEKYELIQRLNYLISANDALGDYKIDIPNYDISSLKDESKIALLKQSIELYAQNIECRKLQKDCLSMFEAINTENNKLLEKEDISEFNEEYIRNEQNINELGKIYKELTARKQKISETVNYCLMLKRIILNLKI